MTLLDLLNLVAGREGVTLRLRSDARCALMLGGQRLEWPAGAPAHFEPEQLKRFVYSMATPEQHLALDRDAWLRWEVGVQGVGRFHLDAFLEEGRWRLNVNDAKWPRVEAPFHGFPELAAEAAAKPSDADVWWNLGIKRMDEREFRAALEAFDQADARCADDPAILEFRAMLLLKLSRGDEALATLRRAVALPKAEATVFFRCAQLLFERRDHDVGLLDEAIRVLEAGRARFPDDLPLRDALEVARGSGLSR